MDHVVAMFFALEFLFDVAFCYDAPFRRNVKS
jgi:hypothetical protein